MPHDRVCFYHTDGDGYCAGAIVARMFDWDLDLCPINYGHDFPWEIVDKETEVIMVDFTLQPFERMLKLREACGNLVWIDHHESEVKQYHEWAARTGDHIQGPKQLGEAGCELTWRHCNPDDDMPWPVRLLGRYDVWDWKETEGALEFQWGFRGQPAVDPALPAAKPFWDVLLGENRVMCDYFTKKIINDGEMLLGYVNKQNLRAARGGCFMTTLEGYPMLACNVGGANSQFFDGVVDEFPEAVAVLSFCLLRNSLWTVSMFQIEGREGPNLGEIAKNLGSTQPHGAGGGGHKGAAGFQWSSWSLPFKTMAWRT